MKLGSILLLAAAVKSLAHRDNLRRSVGKDGVEDTTEHDDDPLELTELTEQSTSSLDTFSIITAPQADASVLLQQLLAKAPEQVERERKMKQLKNKKKLEKAQRQLASKRGLALKREVSHEQDVDDLQFEVDDFAASVQSFEAREKRKQIRQELKMLQ
ncbi:hypothetical protein MPSEU_000559300 [Mayamaea pseudoterrestris]|nr:hypothetical protein MPSEU_000559300 [Mayamaea pseudoterrestris]